MFIFSLNWILNHHQEQVEKSLVDIKEYLESMDKAANDVTGGSDNLGFQGGQSQIQV
jgi:hypothetical protein